MLVYPQLAGGVLSQFPIERRHQFRTIGNAMADGSAIKLADAGAETVEWQLQYVGLSDAELSKLAQFFADAEGSLNEFTFVDPMGNLLAWSDDLGNAVWDRAPLLAASAGDPVDGTPAWHLSNSGAGAQGLTQTVMAPGGYVYCFSVYVKGVAPTVVTLLASGARRDVAIGTGWQRIAVTAPAGATASSVTFGIEIGPGAAVDLYGPQAEAQASPSTYQASTTGGCYESARLQDDTFSFTTTGVNCHSATVNIFHAKHL